jgi:hypothetical protein
VALIQILRSFTAPAREHKAIENLHRRRHLPIFDHKGAKMDSRHLLAIAIIFATLVGAWMFRYEILPPGGLHRNRFTGAVCRPEEECWFRNYWDNR